jgi:hypothetical protein
MAGIEKVEVYLDAGQSLGPALMGTLHRQPSGKGEVISFNTLVHGSIKPKRSRSTRTSHSMNGISIRQRKVRTLASLEIRPRTAGDACLCSGGKMFMRVEKEFILVG